MPTWIFVQERLPDPSDDQRLVWTCDAYGHVLLRYVFFAVPPDSQDVPPVGTMLEWGESISVGPQYYPVVAWQYVEMPEPLPGAPARCNELERLMRERHGRPLDVACMIERLERLGDVQDRNI